MPIKTQARLLSLDTSEEGMIRFCLALDDAVTFNPGQYSRVTIMNSEVKDDRGLSRNLTIASRGENSNTVCYATRKGKSAFKKSLANLNTYSVLEFMGPFGNFMSSVDQEHGIFFACGIGIVPVYSMIGNTNYWDKLSEIFVFHLNGGKEDPVFPLSSDIIKIREQGIPFTYVRVDTGNCEVESDINGPFGFETIREFIPAESLKSLRIYISGPHKMVEEIESMLLENGIDQDRVRVEIFTGY